MSEQPVDDDLEARIRSGRALWESMGGYHVKGWDPETRTLRAGFTVRREYCHTNGTIAQGGFITAWMDAAMAHAVLHETDHGFNVASLEIKVSFLERVGPGEGRVQGRVLRRGKRVAFLEAELFNPEGRLAARATSTGMLVPFQQAPSADPSNQASRKPT
ncbi:MAG: PaaI family thioesterase [Proteobacteria bacterium]|nr:PaaI family thioesterase [Pseudomonadota bacterium]